MLFRGIQTYKTLGSAVEEKKEDEMKIEKLDKAKILQALFNGAKVHTYAHGSDQRERLHLTLADAQEYFDASPDKKFGFLMGRRLDIDLSGDDVDLTKYDKYHGRGRGSNLLKKLK
jgi:hypothetical protein